MEFLIILPLLAAVISSLKSDWNKWLLFGFSLTGLFVLSGNMELMKNSLQYMEFHQIVDYPWLSDRIRFSLGLDGITLFLLILTNVLIPLIIWTREEENKKGMVSLILFMQAGLNGVFMAQDGILFYLFWELAMIPIYFIVLRFSERDAYLTTIRFFIYTFIGSLGMLASLIFLGSKTVNGSFSYNDLYNVQLSFNESLAVGFGFLLAFAVKIPLFPFHTWQANTYTYAPSQGSMLLSGIMLKMGLYGLLRWYLPLASESISHYQNILMVLSIIGVVYGALIAMRQDDMKRLIAYSSLSHVGLIAAGIFSLNTAGINGAVFQMFVHGINVFGLFLAVHVIEKHFGTRNLNELGGIAKNNKIFTVLFFMVVVGTMAAPLTNGFPGEFLLLKGIFDYSPVFAVMGGLTIIFCAVYMLRMFQLSMLGEQNENTDKTTGIPYVDMIPLMVVAVFVISMGIFPQWYMDLYQKAAQGLISIISNSKGVLS